LSVLRTVPGGSAGVLGLVVDGVGPVVLVEVEPAVELPEGLLVVDAEAVGLPELGAAEVPEPELEDGAGALVPVVDGEPVLAAAPMQGSRPPSR
jgi:hypothetical protein